MYYIKYLVIVGVALLSTTTAAVLQSSQHLSTYRSLKAHRVIATWDQAQNMCASEGGNLASPVNEELLSDMQHLIKANSRDNNNQYFIGARVRQVHGQYVSIEGIALEDMPVFDMLERLDPAEGDCLSIDEYKISVVSCWIPLPYICQLNKTTTNYTEIYDSTLNETKSNETALNQSVLNEPVLNKTVLIEPELNELALTGTALNKPVLNNTKNLDCPTKGFMRINSTHKCYKYHTEEKSWWEAEATCKAQGAHLLVLNDEHEAEILAGAFRDIGQFVDRVWTGLRDWTGKGDWKSINGTPVEQLYNVWYYGTKETNSGLLSLTCSYFITLNRKIDTRNCKFGIYYICEQPLE